MTKKASFSDLIDGEKPVLVDFSAEWCGPCKMLAPVLQELAAKLEKRMRIIKIDVDRNPSIAGKYQVQSVPTLILFSAGKVKWRQSGVQSSAQLETQLLNVL